jgi:putative transposase
MTRASSRISWSTNLKLYIGNGYYDTLPAEVRASISSSNKSRWINNKQEYNNGGLTNNLENNAAFYNQLENAPNIKKTTQSLLELNRVFYEIISDAKGIKQHLSQHKETVVNAIEKAKDYIPVADAIKVFNISRGTYHNYKILVLNKCAASHFKWCLKQFPNQLLQQEIGQMEKYLKNEAYQYWSKSSIYFLALRNKDIAMGLSTWYKYCKLLGYKTRHLREKEKHKPLVSHKPNEIWCADVTILKTGDGTKHYIHFLMDHFSKKILGYTVESSAKAKAIKTLLQQAYTDYNPSQSIRFVTDAGVENVNTTVKEFLATTNPKIIHQIAQKCIKSSNSTIEAYNKVIKHQFLLPRELYCLQQLLTALEIDVNIYNNYRPQFSLQGNTPAETYAGKALAIQTYKTHFTQQKIDRIKQNKQKRCVICK